MIKKPFPQEEGIRRRYLYELDRIKTLHGFTNLELAQALGYKSSTFISDLQNGRYMINLQYLMAMHQAFPEFRLQWVLTSSEMPEIKLSNLQGERGKGVAGRKPDKRPAIRKSGPTTKREEKRITSYWDTI